MSIYAAIGGGPAVSAAVDELYRRVLADPELAGYFAGVDVDRVEAHHLAGTLTTPGVPGGTVAAIADVLGPLRAQIVDAADTAAPA